jgi:hypothetical protein
MNLVLKYPSIASVPPNIKFLAGVHIAVIAGLDPAIHHFEKSLAKIDGYAGQARV